MTTIARGERKGRTTKKMHDHRRKRRPPKAENLACQSGGNRVVRVVNDMRKPLPRKELRPPPYAAHRVTRFSPRRPSQWDADRRPSSSQGAERPPRGGRSLRGPRNVTEQGAAPAAWAMPHASATLRGGAQRCRARGRAVQCKARGTSGGGGGGYSSIACCCCCSTAAPRSAAAAPRSAAARAPRLTKTTGELAVVVSAPPLVGAADGLLLRVRHAGRGQLVLLLL